MEHLHENRYLEGFVIRPFLKKGRQGAYRKDGAPDRRQPAGAAASATSFVTGGARRLGWLSTVMCRDIIIFENFV